MSPPSNSEPLQKPASYQSAPHLWASFGFAFNGLAYAWQTQRNFRIHCLLASVVIIAGLCLSLSMTEWALIILCIILMLGAELINTALEYLVDITVGEQFSETACSAKDLSAAACLTCAIGCLAVGLMIFAPKLAALFVTQ
jgi:diacylglycerol kinase (ATP)